MNLYISHFTKNKENEKKASLVLLKLEYLSYEFLQFFEPFETISSDHLTTRDQW